MRSHQLKKFHRQENRTVIAPVKGRIRNDRVVPNIRMGKNPPAGIIDVDVNFGLSRKDSPSDISE